MGNTLDQQSWAYENHAYFFVKYPCSAIQLYFTIQSVIMISKQNRSKIELSNETFWNRSRGEIWSKGDVIHLTPIESEILELLWGHQGQLVSTKQIIQKVWGSSIYVSQDEVYVYIRKLRKKIEIDSQHPQLIQNRYGRGYTLCVEQNEYIEPSEKIGV